MIKYVAMLFVLLTGFAVSGCAGCDSDVGGVPTGDGHWVHCVQNRVVDEGNVPAHKYEYLLPECTPVYQPPHHGGVGTTPTLNEDMAGLSGGGCIEGCTPDVSDMTVDNPTDNPGADMSVVETNGPDMCGGPSDDSGTSTGADMSIPYHDGPCTDTDVDMTTLCHYPPGNPSAYHTICVGNAAVPAHISNHPGDYLGACQ